MMTQIHPTAIIDPKAILGADVQIGPYCVVGADVVLGDRVILKSHVVVDGRTTIGEGTVIYPFASIGSPPQDLKYKGEPSELIIGRHNTIREHCTMNPGTVGGGMKTIVGDHGLFMMSTHVAHDCRVGNNVIMANNATLGGHVQVGDFVLIGGLAAIHQFVRIGSYAVIGGMSGVESDVIPYGRVKGDRASLAGLNLTGMERGGFSKDEIKIVQKAVNALFSDEGTFEERLSRLESEFREDPHVSAVLAFARQKERFGLCQPDIKRAA
ncbi:MAG: acyl-ACP--UDP-N-acetylglucosamine O-acyltransferase [Alphaproteobacteria bacterium]|nr:acyl-ACP--UDP-N-acetylglucosamine O-acyltransferase [Alphaproteobacteria bacterium]